MDGISAVIPFGDKNYYSVRPNIAVPEPKNGNPDTAIDLDGFFALHPALSWFKPIYDAGNLAIVHAIGSPDNTRSHFDAQDYMEAGTPGNKGTADGWLNRYMQAKREPAATPFRAVSLTANLPRTLFGAAPAIAMTNISDFGVRAGAGNNQVAKGFEELYAQGVKDVLRGTGKEAFEAVKMLKKANPQQYAAAGGANYPRSPFGQALLQIAQLIKSDVGVEVAFTDVGGWDTHANQGSSRGQLANRLQDFSAGDNRSVQRPRRPHAQHGDTYDDGVRSNDQAERFWRNRSRSRELSICARRPCERRQSLRQMAGPCVRTIVRRPRPCVDDRLPRCVCGSGRATHGRDQSEHSIPRLRSEPGEFPWVDSRVRRRGGALRLPD